MTTKDTKDFDQLLRFLDQQIQTATDTLNCVGQLSRTHTVVTSTGSYAVGFIKDTEKENTEYASSDESVCCAER